MNRPKKARQHSTGTSRQRSKTRFVVAPSGRDAERLREAADICNLVTEYFGGNREKTALWFRIKNPMLDGLAPRDLVACGRGAQLKRQVVEALSGQ
jgi:uncharacterized protein (DUF2384 family)